MHKIAILSTNVKVEAFCFHKGLCLEVLTTDKTTGKGGRAVVAVGGGGGGEGVT